METLQEITYINNKVNNIKLAAILSDDKDVNDKSLEHGFSYLNELLQTSLDMQDILQIFADEVASYFPLTGINFNFSDDSIKTNNYDKGCCQYQSLLSSTSETLGTLCYSSTQAFSQEQQILLAACQEKLFYPIKNAILFITVQKQAREDHLTGLANRGRFDTVLDETVQQHQLIDDELTLVLLDLDNFKQANDRWGHDAGDQVLVEFADIIRQAIRKTDYAFRFGGDEFAVILEGANTMVATRIAKQIKKMVNCSDLLNHMGVSTSIGFSSLNKQEQKTDFFKRADMALYSAKNAGRNCLRTA